MRREQFERIESEAVFVELLEEHGLYRGEDVAFEDLGETMVRYVGDDFSVDRELFESMEISALLVVGSVRADFIAVSDVLSDFGVFCVSGDVICTDLLCRTECTGVSIGGGLTIENALYADCGNSVLQVNGDLRAKLLFNAQCSIDVRGVQTIELDERASAAEVGALLGVDVGAGDDADDVVRAYFEKYQGE